MEDLTTEVKSMIKKAEQADNSLHALQFSQAAVNAANAIITIANLPKAEDMSA